MKSTPRIVLASCHPEIQKIMWNEAAKQKARQLNFCVELPPAHQGTLSNNEWKEFLAEADAILTSWLSPRLDEDILSLNTRLRFVGHAGGSVAGIASTYLFEKGIPVSSANRAIAETVARWYLMMTFIGLRKTMFNAQVGSATRMHWNRGVMTSGSTLKIKDISNATIGLWGYGDVSKRLIEMMRPFHPQEILICDDFIQKEEASGKGLRKVNFDELFAQSDLVHIVQGLTKHTRGSVKAEHLASMKDQAVLVNAGRAHLIDEKSFYKELRRNRISAILDVFHKEPLPDDSPLHGLPNVMMTPHIAGIKGNFHYVPLVLEEFHRLLNGEPLQYRISPEKARHMTDSRLSR